MKTISMLAILVMAMALPAGAQMGGSSVTGTVVTAGPDSLVVQTASGEMSFKVAPTADRPATLTAGSKVRVMYTPSDPGYGYRNVATKVTMESATSAEPRTQTPMSSEPTSRATETRETARETAQNRRENEMPATASPLPLLGLTGFAALGVGFAMRWSRTSRSSS